MNFFDILTRGTAGFFVLGAIISATFLFFFWIILPVTVGKIKSTLSDTNRQLAQINKHLMGIEELLKQQADITNLQKEPKIYSEVGFKREENESVEPIETKDENV